MENADEKLVERLKEKYGYTFKEFFNDNVYSINGISQINDYFMPEAMAFYTNDNLQKCLDEIEQDILVDRE